MIGIKISECEIVVNDCERVIILKLDKLLFKFKFYINS